MRYVSTRGRAPEARVRRHPAVGSRAGRRPVRAGLLPEGRGAELARGGASRTPISRPTIIGKFVGAEARWPAGRRLARPVPRDVHGGDVRLRPSPTATRAASRRCAGSSPDSACSNCPTGRRWRSRTWRCSCWVACSSTCCAQAGQPLNILGATSGDTGSAAEYAMRGRRGHQGLHAVAARPHERVPARADVSRCRTPTSHNLAVDGDVRRLPGPRQGSRRRPRVQARWHLGAVNSINWGRIVAQVVYYFHGYFAATTSNEQRVSFAVPSGNFGNILAGLDRALHGPADRAT